MTIDEHILSDTEFHSWDLDYATGVGNLRIPLGPFKVGDRVDFAIVWDKSILQISEPSLLSKELYEFDLELKVVNPTSPTILPPK